MTRVAPAIALAALLSLGAAPGAPARRTTTVTTYGDPAWSPDGKLIAAVESTTVSDRQAALTSESIVVIDVRSGRPVRVVATVDPRDVAWPDWSPDGRRIAFGNARLYVVGADGRGLRELGGGCCPAWGPGGRRIAFSTTPEVQSEVFVIDADGRRRIAVATPDGGHSYWGRRGRRTASAWHSSPTRRPTWPLVSRPTSARSAALAAG
jgi:dipeptidyl aminopeptidase/acylaminoacyl peptidase